jgi:hypothetical protein
MGTSQGSDEKAPIRSLLLLVIIPIKYLAVYNKTQPDFPVRRGLSNCAFRFKLCGSACQNRAGMWFAVWGNPIHGSSGEREVRQKADPKLSVGPYQKLPETDYRKTTESAQKVWNLKKIQKSGMGHKKKGF